VNNIPHPYTFVSFSKEEALQFVSKSTFPLVGKTLIGAAGSGVELLNSPNIAKEYVKKVFKSGVKRRYGPNRKTGTPQKWIVKALKSPTYLLIKLKDYKARSEDVQKGVILLQEIFAKNTFLISWLLISFTMKVVFM